LTLGRHCIDFSGGAQFSRRANPGQDVATGVIQNHDGTILHMTGAQFTQLLIQTLQRHAL
jgi:hypothetical protein